MAHLSKSMETATRVIGRMVSSMGMASKSRKIMPNMMDITKRTKKMELALISGLMDQNTAGAGRTTKCQELV